jgi:hypothetical protein
VQEGDMDEELLKLINIISSLEDDVKQILKELAETVEEPK